jgi:hypothetical protein
MRLARILSSHLAYPTRGHQVYRARLPLISIFTTLDVGELDA